MNTSKLNEVMLSIDDSKNCLCFMRGLVERLKGLEEDSIEKEQCIQSMSENIDVVISQMNMLDADIKSLYTKTKENIPPNFNDNFVMEDMKVLIVDDNEINNYVVGQMLSKFGIDVELALSGEEALVKYEENEYDIVLMDYLLGNGMNGIETVEKIRQINEHGKSQFIIGLTTDSSDTFKNGLNKQDVELILYKPLKCEQMALILKKEFSHKIKK